MLSDKIKVETQRFGFMILITNESGFSGEEILTLYRSKDRIEKVFLSLKHDLNEKRNRVVHGLESFRGSLFINFISLILISLIDHTMREKGLYKKMSKSELYKILNRLKVYNLDGGKQILGEVSKKQKDMIYLKALDCLFQAQTLTLVLNANQQLKAAG